MPQNLFLTLGDIDTFFSFFSWQRRTGRVHILSNRKWGGMLLVGGGVFYVVRERYGGNMKEARKDGRREGGRKGTAFME